MLKSAAILAGLAIATADDHINVNDVNAQYFVGFFNGNEFPLAIGQCNPLDIFGQNGYQKATCADENTISWDYYLDDECASSISTVEYNSSWKTGTGTLYDFSCDDRATESYASIEFAAFTCSTASKVTMNAALASCAFLATDEVSIQIFCEPGWAELYYFDSEGESGADCSDEEDVYNIANATEECGFMLKTSGIKVYGNILGCYGWNETASVTTSSLSPSTSGEDSGGSSSGESDSDSASHVFGVLGLFVATLLAAAKLH